MSAMKPKSGPLANISYNTNNPVLADSRVFVGNLRTEIITQEQLHKLFKRFGPITGLSIHKGYGFVQFTNEKNARSAVDGTHGSEVGGQKIGEVWSLSRKLSLLFKMAMFSKVLANLHSTVAQNVNELYDFRLQNRK